MRASNEIESHNGQTCRYIGNIRDRTGLSGRQWALKVCTTLLQIGSFLKLC